ncbi:MAG: hypothetical protein IT431_12740 [Phycisphaerales bacterium]|nr:hypothetical protein [Phycisphaerales bacterium]
MTNTRTMIGALVASAGTCFAQDLVRDWNAANGNWNSPANWSPQDVPDSSNESARIAVGGVYTVTMNMSPTIAWLDILNPDATLHLPAMTLTLLDASGLTNEGTVRGYNDGTIVGNITNYGVFSVRGYNQYLQLNGPTVTNDGVMIVNPEHAGTYGLLRFGADVTLQGTGYVRLDWSRAYLSTSTDMTVTQLEGHGVYGEGEVRARMVNNGLVEADVAGATMTLNTDPKVNNASMRAVGGGILAVEGVAIDQTGGGTLLAQDGSKVVLDSCTIIGGVLDSAGSGYVEHSDDSTLTGVTNLGLLNLRGYNLYTSVNGSGLINDGLVVVNWNNPSYAANLHFMQAGALGGVGTVTLNTGSAHLSSAADATVAHAPSHTIDGQGHLSAAMANAGLVDANRAGQTLYVDGHAKTNTGSMRASDEGLLWVQYTTIDQTGGGELLAQEGSAVRLDHCTIIGGTLESAGSGYVEHYDHSTLTGVTNLGLLNLRGYNLNTSIRGSGLTNDGLIVVNWAQAGYYASLYFAESGTLGGSGLLRLNYPSARLESAEGVTMVHGPSHTIDGWGEISAAVDNYGLIDADEPGQEMVANTYLKRNYALMRATGGGILRVSHTTIDQTGGGTMLAADGSRIALYSSTIVGGVLDSEGSGSVEHDSGSCTLTGVTNNGLLNLRGYNLTAGVRGGRLTNNGQIVENWDSAGYYAALQFEESGVLDGSGTVTLRNGTSYVQTAGGVTMTQGPAHTIEGWGWIQAAMDNQGLIDANSAGHELVAYAEPKRNRSLMRATGGGVLRVSSTTIDQTGGGTLLGADGSVVAMDGCTIVGGTLDSEGSGFVEHHAGGCTLTGVTNNGLLNLRGYNLSAGVRGGRLTNNGRIVANWDNAGYYSSLDFLESGILDGVGTVTLNTGSSYLQAAGGVTCTIGPDQIIEGIGTMNGVFVSHGTLAPGLSVGTLHLGQATLGMGADAVLEIELASTGSFDRIDGSGVITVGGTVDVSFAQGYQPVLWDEFAIVYGDSVAGEFGAITGDALPGGLVYKVRYEPRRAVLIITCPPDTNADGAINTLDFLAYLNLWTARDPEADWDANGVVNTLDFLAYLNAWVGGCE